MNGLLILAALLAQSPVFDMHVHLHDGEKSLRAYQEQTRAADVEPTGIAAMWFGGGNLALAGDPEGTRRSNDALIALAARNPGVLPVATVHPYDGETALAEIARVAERGVKILKIHPHTQRFDAADPRVLALVTRAGELGLIVLMDNASIVPGDNQKLFNLALAAPKTRFIFAHMGAMDFRFWNILALARTAENLFAENIYFDVSMVPLMADSPIEDEYVWTMRNVGIDRLLLGSDYPQIALADTLEALDRLPLSDAEKAKIRYENARELFGLEAADKAR
jgi:predicted TIM-barrel fold metal-dependent hydrolase